MLTWVRTTTGRLEMRWALKAHRMPVKSGNPVHHVLLADLRRTT